VIGLGALAVIRLIDTGTAGAVAVAPDRDAVLVTTPDAHAFR
jgi:hypothetical protein